MACILWPSVGWKDLASGGGWRDETIKLWDIATGREFRALPAPNSNVYSVAFS